jgi:dihydropyrimidinase
VLNAKNKLVFPGGIDPHVHFDLETPLGKSSDSFETGSRAALFGGTTSIIDFVTPLPGQSLIEALNERKQIAKNCFIDYGFHMSITSWNKNTAKEMRQCVEHEGINSFKVYLAYQDTIGISENELSKVLENAKKLDATVCVHCENDTIIKNMQSELINKNKLSPFYHPKSRPPKAESEAVKSLINLSEKFQTKIYIVHVSAKESVEQIELSQKSNKNIFAETCTQYLLLDEKLYNLKNFESAKYVMSPPLREKSHQEKLWKAIANGRVQTIVTDHCPFHFAGQKNTGSKDFTKIPNGIGGVEHRLSLIYTYGVLEGLLSKQKFVELCSTNAAKHFGMYPKKGAINVGSDADIVIWDTKKSNTISAKTHHQNCDYNAYENFKTIGSPEYVIINGKIVIKSGKLLNKNLKGEYLYRR